METIELRINGFSHGALGKTSTEWVKQAMGRRLTIMHTPIENFSDAVGVYNGFARVGWVGKTSLPLAHRALDGSGKETLVGEVTEVDEKGYWVMLRLQVKCLAPATERVCCLADWDYTGPVVDNQEWESLLHLSTLQLMDLAADDAASADELRDCTDTFCRLSVYDFSGEAIDEAETILQHLRRRTTPHHREAAGAVQSMLQHKGGEHWRAGYAAWLAEDFAHSHEVMSACKKLNIDTCHLVVAKAEALPDGLLTLWRTAPLDFVNALRGMAPSRQKVRCLLSCLVLTDAAEKMDQCVAKVSEMFVDVTLDMNDSAVTKSFEVLLGRVNDLNGGAAAAALERLRRGPEEWERQKRERMRSEKGKVAPDGENRGEPLQVGRPKGVDDIRSLMPDKELADQHLRQMDALIRGHKGKRAALVVRCAVEAGWLIGDPSFEQMCDAFGPIGQKGGYYKQKEVRFTDKEKAGVRRLLGIGD